MSHRDSDRGGEQGVSVAFFLWAFNYRGRLHVVRASGSHLTHTHSLRLLRLLSHAIILLLPLS